MHRTSVQLEDLTLFDLLTVDTHGGKISIHDKSENQYCDLIPNRKTFFSPDGLYADVEKNGITFLHEGQEPTHQDLQEFLNELDEKRGSCVVFIEGFAGCGKSTLVQYILSKKVDDSRYDYSFFNYDLEAQNDLLIRNEQGEIIKKSSIYEAIKKSFLEQFITSIKINKNVFTDFTHLLELCELYQTFNSLYFNFFKTNTYKDMAAYINEGIEGNEDLIFRILWTQTNAISSSSCLLALDYLFRLAMYKNRMLDKLYICYDNLDAIEDATDLQCFDDHLAQFSRLIDAFIILLQQKKFFVDLPAPHFVIIATYRKITAIMVKISETYKEYKEVLLDKCGRREQNRFIFYIDATTAFSYRKIVEKRKQYFENYYKSIPYISQKKKQKILSQLSSWNTLNQNLEIMHDKYARLWNKNYRTCSLIANELYEDPNYHFSDYVDYIEESKINDGYSAVENGDGSNILGTYYGGSAILLNSVCKVFHSHHIWDEFLYLTPLNKTPSSHKNISFSRIILTYIYNSNQPVSLKELFDFFCKEKLFSYQELCHILSKMLARNTDGVWRRPIYYSQECILTERAKDIENYLLSECKLMAEGKQLQHQYEFILCDSGQAYVEQLVQEFEFFSNRLSEKNDNEPLYLYRNIDKIASIVDEVYQAVSLCCENMAKFREEFCLRKNITAEKYLFLPIHPITNSKNSPQLHTERIIFSHIAYLNNVRLYYLDNAVTPDFEEQKRYNEMFVYRIEKYLNLYNTQIKPVTAQRALVANGLKNIVDSIKTAIEQGENDPDVLFRSVSL